MGLFDLIGELVSAPLQIAGTVAKTVVKTTGHVVTGDIERVGQDLEDAADEAWETAEKVADAVEK